METFLLPDTVTRETRPPLDCFTLFKALFNRATGYREGDADRILIYGGFFNDEPLGDMWLMIPGECLCVNESSQLLLIAFRQTMTSPSGAGRPLSRRKTRLPPDTATLWTW